MRYSLFAITLVLALTGCSDSTNKRPKDFAVPDLPEIKAKLAFTCSHELDRIPARDPEADQLYKYARWLRKSNLTKRDPSVFPIIERLIRISTASGHDKANLELRELIANGEAKSLTPIAEAINLTEDLINRGVPGGYYDMGQYLERGYGVVQDHDLALKYFRKSADLGSPDGQYLVGRKLLPVDAAPDVAKAMLLCATEQGHGTAGLELGVDLKTDKQYEKSLVALQLSVKAGHYSAASFLQHGFEGPPANDELYYLGQQKDLDRARRYEAIGKTLFDYDYLNPKVPEIDEIVPLPPAKLPPWDGKLKWLEEHKANVPPPLPSEARIAEMAKAKGLDPATGRPLAWGNTR
ncbi:MAG: sel1 repeat family protein [Aquabacterium sp.]|nr:sel1 repeat family protein [Aquabacterium sp.]